MLDLYESTSLSKKKVAQKTGFLDWNMQPSIFKRYPSSLFSYSLSTTPQLRLLNLTRCVTSEHKIAGKPYKRLNTPSAGNLHPLEVYVQIRGVKGVLSGIYHLNSDKDKLVLIRDIESDGIENMVGLSKRFKGMIIMISLVPFRSIWKYQERAIRYCYLDLGHQIASLEIAAISEQQKMTFLSDFDTFGLSKKMGMDEQEKIVSVAVCGEEGHKPVKGLEDDVMCVQPTDYYERHKIQESVFNSSQGISSPGLELKNISCLDEYVLNRRSAREFTLKSIRKEHLERIMHILLQLPQSISYHIVLMRGESYKPGLYQGTCLKREGIFVNEIVDLLLHQQFIYNASLVLVFSSSDFNAIVLTQAAFYAHSLSVQTHVMGLGLSGVGAFYDQELQEFLGTQESILYCLAIGYTC
ncbi:nitroreductase family protein [Campylobacterota bacterium]